MVSVQVYSMAFFQLPIMKTCELIYGMQIINQHKVTSAQLVQANDALKRFARGFEELYYQRRVSHSFCSTKYSSMLSSSLGSNQGWPASHLIAIDDGADNCQELRQPSNLYANLAQGALLHCRISTLKNIIPDLKEPTSRICSAPTM